MTTDDLAAAVARLRNAPRQYVIDGSPDMSAVQSNDVLLIISALESAQADARRYRWLRPRLYSIDFDYSDAHATVLVFEAPVHPLGPGHALDAAIDAAMGDSDA